MKPQKGFDYLLTALPLLEGEGLRDIWVLMVGDGPMRAYLERRAVEIGCGEKVKFLGVRRDVPQLLRAMDLFAFPSLWEGFGTSLVEAMAAEVPIVASDLPCVREIIPDERYGQLVPPQDGEALARGILQVWRSGEMRETRVGAAKERAFQFFSLAQVVEEYQRLFQEVLSRKFAEGFA
jgi:glycosyltransferase involved in cell wall biosynthesis